MKGHPHAKLAQEYWKEAETDDEAWRNWDRRHHESNTWDECGGDPIFSQEFEYRRRPRTININGFEVPEPVRDPLKRRQEYWIVSISEGSPYTFCWGNDSVDTKYLKSGLIHLTEEAAQLHIDALLSFTKK